MKTERTSTATNPSKTVTTNPSNPATSKTTSTTTKRLFIILTAIVLVLVVGTAAVMAAIGYRSRVTLFKGKIEITGAVPDTPPLNLTVEGEEVGRYANLATEDPVDFPVLTEVNFIDGDWADISGRRPVHAGLFKLSPEYGVAENLRCRLEVRGSDQLIPCVRVGVAIINTAGECMTETLHGFANESETDVSVSPYSMNIGTIVAENPITIRTCVWIDKAALTEAGIYGDSSMEISLIFY